MAKSTFWDELLYGGMNCRNTGMKGKEGQRDGGMEGQRNVGMVAPEGGVSCNSMEDITPSSKFLKE